MGFLTWLSSSFSRKGEQQKISASGDSAWTTNVEITVRELAFWACVNLMASAVAKCEFRTFSGGAEIKAKEHYLWNYSPNKNQSKEQFVKKWISQLYCHNEALVVEVGGQLLVADSFYRDQFAIKEDVFSDVRVGDLTLRRSFLQSEVLYIQLSEESMRGILNALYSSYSRLLDYSLKSYQRSRGMKGILNIDAPIGGSEEENQRLNAEFAKNYKTFADAENGILTLRNGLAYTDLAQRTYSNEGTRDIRAMIDDVFDFTAKGFNIPPALISGKVAGIDDAFEEFLTFPLASLVGLIETEINRKRNGESGIARGNYLKIDTRTVRHIDVMSAPAGIDKLISSGVYSVNDIRQMLGETIIDEPWAWQHYITKNYEEIEAAKGGEKE